MQPGSFALQSLTDSYAGNLQALLELLEAEQAALKSQQFDKLTTYSSEKQALLTQLEQLEQQRQQLQSANGEDASPAAAFPAPLGAMLKKCRDLNQVNGGLIEITRQFNQRMLKTILGAPEQEDMYYDASGNNAENRSNQVFARI